ncbi:hypothetical protein CERSUDRAFT_126812 [Gelatoporia subvermispora B]|uniref:DUF6534 domain-containing protein n=1 Tax=Ceriporiopsis subvermispora (strain B) TaxID=914234 RepID=M2R0L8_CERS8|nr:hypothetical protein CERSUDRAFT_126812 [Gelatoporia subvermispora B]
MASPPPINHHLDGTLGALQICTILSSALYGVTVIQTYIYFHQSSKDSYLYKAVSLTSAYLRVMGTTHQVAICQMAYQYTVTDYGNIIALTRETKSIIVVVFLSAFMDTGVRSLFCLRIWHLSGKNWFLAAVIMLFSLGEFASLIANLQSTSSSLPCDRYRYTVKVFDTPETTHAVLQPEFYVATSLTIVADLLIALSQVVLLWRHRSGVPRTDSIMRTLIIYSINTGLLTTICALVLLISWAAMPNNLVYDIFYAALPTLLYNALLATLNARQELREIASGNAGLITLGVSMSNVQPSSSVASTQITHLEDTQENNLRTIEIKIDHSEQVV